MIKKFAAIAALLVAAAPALSAQTDTLRVVDYGQSTFDGHFFVGPYDGELDHQPLSINCVDVFHEVTAGDTWAVYVSPLTGDLSNTRLGGDPNAQSLYEQAAFLTTQYGGVSTAQDTADIQHAIWRLFGSNTDLTNDGLGYMIDANSDSWLSFANSNYASAPINYGDYVVLTPNLQNYTDRNSPQEFIATVPEPTSMALLGTGLIGLVPVFRRRKRA